ncbi:MAG: hypothetical protein IJQ77_01745 [Synergistaceae bacterium]|nr:hypothetical protein [Synergistaceae bacterium]
MEFYDGPTWTIECKEGEYVFDNEETAKWFQECRSVFKMKFGCMARDGGNFFMTESERDEVLKREPALKKFIRQCYGSREFIQNVNRFCFWLVDISPAEIRKSKILYERVKKVKEFRLKSEAASTQKAAETPHLFVQRNQPATNYLLIPRHSSELRQYVPMGYLSHDVIALDSCMTLEHATPYHFGILTSRTHMAWMRFVCGRLRSDYRYSNTIVYNCFAWPESNPYHVARIESTAKKILNARAKYPDSSLADLYDELTMPKELRDAHRENDAAVCEAYGLPADISESDMVMHMFRLYYAATGQEWPEEF